MNEICKNDKNNKNISVGYKTDNKIYKMSKQQ